MKKATETSLRRACLALLELLGIFAWKNNTGSLPIDGRYVAFGCPGSSDILAVLPPEGRLLAVETKLPGRKPTAIQRAWLDAITAAGGLAIVAHSVQELQDILREHGYGL